MFCLYNCSDDSLCCCVCSQATAACLATFLVDVLTAGNRLNAKVSSVVEKVQPFTRPDVLQKKGKSKKKVCIHCSLPYLHAGNASMASLS